MNKIKLYIAYVIAFMVFIISVFFYGKQKGREDVNKKSVKKVLKAKDIDALSFNELVDILSKRIHK